MMILILIIHVTVCVGLIALVLIQRGRGGGLVEGFSGMESMFGTKTSALLTKTTTILSIGFFFTCLFLAVLSVHQSKSLMKDGLRMQPVATGKATAGSAGNETKSDAAKQTTTPAAPAVTPAATQETQAKASQEAPKAQ